MIEPSSGGMGGLRDKSTQALGKEQCAVSAYHSTGTCGADHKEVTRPRKHFLQEVGLDLWRGSDGTDGEGRIQKHKAWRSSSMEKSLKRVTRTFALSFVSGRYE